MRPFSVGISSLLVTLVALTEYTEAWLFDSSAEAGETKEAWKNASTIYEFSAKDIDGNQVSLDKYRGHVCLIVNVASQ